MANQKLQQLIFPGSTTVYDVDAKYILSTTPSIYIKNNNTFFATCSTAAATAAKTVTLSGFVLTTGSRISVKFSNTNTAASPTLNVNETGAKNIYYAGAAISAGYLVKNKILDFIYNGTQWEYVGYVDTNTNTYGRSSNTTSKIFLIGPTSQSTSNKTTYSNVNCYAEGGYLYSGGTKVSVEGHAHSYAPINHATTTTTYGVGDANKYGHVILYPASSCTTYTSDSGGACTPAAVRQAVSKFTTVSPILTSGTKIATITIDGTAQDLYCETNTNTHYTTKLFATTASGTAHAATTNGNTYLRLFDDSTARQSIKITGSGATTVSSDAAGVITISSTDNNDYNKVAQAYDATTTSNIPLLFSATAGITSTSSRGDTTTKLNNKFYVKPSTGTMYSTIYQASTSMKTPKVVLGDSSEVVYDSTLDAIKFVFT